MLLSLAGDSTRRLGPSGGCPLGWLNARQVAVLERATFSSGDSSAIWAYDVNGSRSMLGTIPRTCRLPALAPNRQAVVCIMYSQATSDVWIADDFAPYFRPPTAPRRP